MSCQGLVNYSGNNSAIALNATLTPRAIALFDALSGKPSHSHAPKN
ncbi:hypothetical protein [Calothrix sp. NIES-2098]